MQKCTGCVNIVTSPFHYHAAKIAWRFSISSCLRRMNKHHGVGHVLEYKLCPITGVMSAVGWFNPELLTERMPLCSAETITCCQMFHRRPNVACECISAHWAPVHLFTGPPSQEPTPCPISDLWANQNVSSVLWNQWVSADAGHRGKE